MNATDKRRCVSQLSEALRFIQNARIALGEDEDLLTDLAFGDAQIRLALRSLGFERNRDGVISKLKGKQ